MEFIDIPTEQTTAATDAILAVLAFYGVLRLKRAGRKDQWKANIWVGVLALLGIAAMLGAIVHGLKLSEQTQSWLWHPLFLSLGILVALFLVAVVYDLKGKPAAGMLLPFALLTGLGFFIYITFAGGTFKMFVAYQGIVMLVAFCGYVWLALIKQLAGARLVASGILLTLFAAWVQANKALSFTFIWAFDHNGVYHLIEMLAIIMLIIGVNKALVSPPSDSSNSRKPWSDNKDAYKY